MTSAELGVQLPSDTSASALLYALLRKACEHFDELKHVKLPENSRGFREDPAALFERQIHGGVYTTGHALIDVIKIAAVYGFARKPSLIAAMARGK